MPIHQVFCSASVPSKDRHNSPGDVPRSILILIALCLVAPLPTYSQQKAIALPAGSPPNMVILPPQPTPIKAAVASEISVMGMVPYSDRKIFSATTRATAWTVAIQYDRNSWGHFLKSQMDYVAEVTPLILLSQPAVSDFWGNAIGPRQQLVHGIAVSPFGVRWLWRSNANVMPYLSGTLGAAVFDKKAFSQRASYANFNIQCAFGIAVRFTNHLDLRIEPFQFFHISNGYLAASNPGMDQIGLQYGISYHLGKQAGRRQ